MINLVMILGLGGSGKSTLAKGIIQSLKIKGFYTRSSHMIMYTTRPKRGEGDSDYTFYDANSYKRIMSEIPEPSDLEKHTVLSDRFYEVENGDGANDVWRYGILVPNSDLCEVNTIVEYGPNNPTYVLAASVSQVLDVLTFMASSKKNKESINLILVFMSSFKDEDGNERLERLRKSYLREKESEHPNYAEVLRRFFDDDSKEDLLMNLEKAVEPGGLYFSFVNSVYDYDTNKTGEEEHDEYASLVNMITYAFKNNK